MLNTNFIYFFIFASPLFAMQDLEDLHQAKEKKNECQKEISQCMEEMGVRSGSHVFKGGEGFIYFIPDDDKRVLKVARSKKTAGIKNFNTSKNLLIEVRMHLRENYPFIKSRHMTGAQIYTHGNGWLKKRFYKNSFPFGKKLKQNESLERKYNYLLAWLELERKTCTDKKSKEILNLLFRRLKNKSVNVHFDDEKNRFVLIDAQ